MGRIDIMAKRKLKENGPIMRVAPEFKRLVEEKQKESGKKMTVITGEIARKMRRII